jgi:predicted metal-binding membrane protein
MDDTAPDLGGGRADLLEAYGAIRSRPWLFLALFGAAGLAWIVSADRMSGMDAGPGTDLGAFGWFLGVWVVMMAAMMLPSAAPTVTLYSRMTRERGLGRPLLFTGGYLLVWVAAGAGAYALFRLGESLAGGALAWDDGGQWLVAGILAIAIVYEVTPLKQACLKRCRSPISFLIVAWRNGRLGAFELGIRHAAWCVGCCWALMAALFALGVMSLAWMGFVAALIALQKLLPGGRAVTGATAAVLGLLLSFIVFAPESLPGFVMP